MRILIVDDELLVRIGLKSSIEWSKHGIEIVGEASNGKEALEKIEIFKPDVILLDIKMPVMDGIEVLQAIRERKYPCKSIILSSFDDLEHVKDAMKLGALDYLHKPCMSPDGILKALLNAKAEFEKDAENPADGAIKPTENKDTLDASSFLRELADGLVTNEARYQEGLKAHHIGLGRSNYSCIAFSIINYNKIQRRYSDNNRELLNKSVLDILGQVFMNKKEIAFFQYAKNLFIGIVSMEKAVSSKEMIEQQHRNIHLIIDSLKKFLDIEVAIGLSETHPFVKNVHTAFIEAFRALQHRFYNPLENVVFYGALVPNRESKGLLSKISQHVLKLKECLANQNHYQYKTIIEEIFALLRQSPFLSVEEVVKLFSGVLFLMNELDTCFEEMNLISECETLDELQETFRQIINRKLVNCMEEDQYKNCSFLVKKILGYVNSNYDKDLSLTVLSAHLNVSPNYISRVFKDEVGKTLFNYINEVRVEQAKKLMHQQELKIYEIGEKVGFNSAVHFNIVFNKLTGYSPKQYRDTLIS